MISQEVSQPKSPPDALAKIGHVARAARAEAPNRRVTHTNYQQTPFLLGLDHKAERAVQVRAIKVVAENQKSKSTGS